MDKNSYMNFREKYSVAKEFLCHNLWLQEVTQEANQLRLWGLSVLRILVIVVRDFVQNKIILHYKKGESTLSIIAET